MNKYAKYMKNKKAQKNWEIDLSPYLMKDMSYVGGVRYQGGSGSLWKGSIVVSEPLVNTSSLTNDVIKEHEKQPNFHQIITSLIQQHLWVNDCRQHSLNHARFGGEKK